MYRNQKIEKFSYSIEILNEPQDVESGNLEGAEMK
jgi:hypothetical protein